MIRSAGLFLLWTSLWCWQVRLSQCYTYELRAHVTLRDEDYENEHLLVGDFTEYGKKSTEKTKGRLVSVDATYGCQGSNSTLEGASGAFIAILPLSDCNDYLQAKKAEQERAIGVVFYYTSDKDKEWSSGEEDLSIPVAVIKVDVDAVGRITGRDAPAYYSVEVEGQLYPVVPQQRTFYFIVTAICILILLSCLWFFTSYFRRCRYSFRNQRRQVSSIVLCWDLQLEFAAGITQTKCGLFIVNVNQYHLLGLHSSFTTMCRVVITFCLWGLCTLK